MFTACSCHYHWTRDICETLHHKIVFLMQWSDYQIICTRTSSDKIWSSLPKNMLRNIALHHLANVDSHHVYITNLLFTDIKYTSNTQYSHYLSS